MVAPIHLVSNLKFDMGIIFIVNYSFNDRQRLHQQQDDCGDFVNLKIRQIGLSNVLIGKLRTHRGSLYMYMFIDLSAHMYMSIHICIVFLKKISALTYVNVCWTLNVMSYYITNNRQQMQVPEDI
jgi:hypothetical protein